MQANKSYDAFALALGQQQRKTLDATLPWHKQFVKATPELQGEMRVRWLTAFIQGYLGKTEQQAATIVAQSRTERLVEAQQAYDAGRQQFSYHIVRKVSGKNETKTAGVRLPSGAVERVAAAYAGLTRAQIIEAHKRALAALQFE